MHFVCLVSALALSLVSPAFATCGRRSVTVTTPSSSTTASSSAPTATTSAPAIYYNTCSNGDFSVVGPNGTVPDWNSTNVHIVTGAGQNGGNAAQFSVGPTSNPSKLKARQSASDTSTPASMEQYLTNMDLTTSYTIRLFYQVTQCSTLAACNMRAYYGGVLFNSTTYFPAISTAVKPTWQEFISSAAVSTSNGLLTFEVVCLGGASATVNVDEIFVSNQVTPSNVDNVTIAYTASPTTPPTPTTSGPSLSPSPTCPTCVRAATATNAYYCSKVGYPISGIYGEPTDTFPYQRSNAECAAACFQISGCMASAYNNGTQVCNFLNVVTESLPFQASKNQYTNTTWSDLSCWSCASC